MPLSNSLLPKPSLCVCPMVLAQMLLARRLLSVVSRFLRIRTFPALAGIDVVVWVRLNVGGGAALFCALRGG